MRNAGNLSACAARAFGCASTGHRISVLGLPPADVAFSCHGSLLRKMVFESNRVSKYRKNDEKEQAFFCVGNAPSLFHASPGSFCQGRGDGAFVCTDAIGMVRSGAPHSPDPAANGCLPLLRSFPPHFSDYLRPHPGWPRLFPFPRTIGFFSCIAGLFCLYLLLRDGNFFWIPPLFSPQGERHYV